jgi:hypothetical protein
VFLSWRDQHTIVAQLQAKINLAQPKFEIAAPQSGVTYDPHRDLTFLYVLVGITNTGAPSVAGGWRLQFDSPQLHTVTSYSRLPAKQTMQDFEADFKDEDSIYERAREKPIERGAAVSGWALFVIPGKAAAEDINKGRAKMHLICYDYLEHEHKSPAFWPGTEAVPPDYFPGVRGGFKPRNSSPH